MSHPSGSCLSCAVHESSTKYHLVRANKKKRSDRPRDAWYYVERDPDKKKKKKTRVYPSRKNWIESSSKPPWLRTTNNCRKGPDARPFRVLLSPKKTRKWNRRRLLYCVARERRTRSWNLSQARVIGYTGTALGENNSYGVHRPPSQRVHARIYQILIRQGHLVTVIGHTIRLT